MLEDREESDVLAIVKALPLTKRLLRGLIKPCVAMTKVQNSRAETRSEAAPALFLCEHIS